jgi:hypothetical protein
MRAMPNFRDVVTYIEARMAEKQSKEAAA